MLGDAGVLLASGPGATESDGVVLVNASAIPAEDSILESRSLDSGKSAACDGTNPVLRSLVVLRPIPIPCLHLGLRCLVLVFVWVLVVVHRVLCAVSGREVNRMRFATLGDGGQEFTVVHVHQGDLIHDSREPPRTLMIQVHGWMPISIRVWSALVNKGVEERPRVQVLGTR